MKKSLIALVIGVAAFGFANTAKADVTAGVAGSLSFSVSSSQVDGSMMVEGSVPSLFARSHDTSGDVTLAGMNNAIDAIANFRGDGSVDGSLATASKGSADKTSVMVSSSSAASLSIVDGGSGNLTDRIAFGKNTGIDTFSAAGKVEANSMTVNDLSLYASSFAGW